MIRYFLHSALLIDEKVLIDPHDGVSIGLPPIDAKPEVVLVTHDHYDHNACELFDATCHKEVPSLDYKGYNVVGIRTYHDKRKGKERGRNTIYIVTTPDGRKIVHLGDLGHTLSEEQIERIEGADLLAVPVGGVITINYREAIELINRAKPKNVLPIHYWIKGHYMPLDPLDGFVNTLGGWKTVYLRNESVDEKTFSNTVFIV